MNCSLATTISSKGFQSEWLDRLNKVLLDAEAAEKELSYISQCGTERARKLSGSYYTPIDVARYFWHEFFLHCDLTSADKAKYFANHHTFVEPSVGAGVLFFAFLERLVVAGLSPSQLSEMEVDLVDINSLALEFIQESIKGLEQDLGITFRNLRLSCVDFRKADFNKRARPLVFFGNPPFVANTKGTSHWKNLFADFLEKSLSDSGTRGSVHFILPLSISFSRDYRPLRLMLKDHPRKIAVSNFDNIPDTLFKAGKPLHDNSNKANSQRCSILTVLPSDSPIILSTKLHRWSKKDRYKVLGQSPEYFNVTQYSFDDQIPRPENEQLLRYLSSVNGAYTLGDLVKKSGKYSLNVAGVARNYIGIREGSASGVHNLKFDRLVDFYSALNILTSDLFRDYWLTIGDGFHVTKSNVFDFPVSPCVSIALARNQRKIKRIWDRRSEYAKSKLNSGIKTNSYDFSSAVPSLYQKT